LVEWVFVTWQDRQPQFTTDTIEVVLHLLRNTFLNDVVEEAVRIVWEACEMYAGRHYKVDSVLFKVVLCELGRQHSEPSVLAHLVGVMNALSGKSERLTSDKVQ
jgi:hypothetical protein